MAKSAWLVYLRERFPLPVYFGLAAGYAVSGPALFEGGSPWVWTYALLGLLLFFWVLRLMDELKDYDKDRVANPGRPLPRGLIGVSEVARAIRQLSGAMVVFAALVALRFNPVAGFCYLMLTAHLWLMYREFYVGEWLERRPLLYAVSHQLCLVWVSSFPVLLQFPDALFESRLYFWACLSLGAFFTYEISRKQNPASSEVLRTYRQVYGVGGSLLIALATQGVAAFGAWGLGLGAWLWPVEALVLVSFGTLRFAWGHKVLESLAGVALLVHLWSVALFVWMERTL